jgi:hypothetical protein
MWITIEEGDAEIHGPPDAPAKFFPTLSMSGCIFFFSFHAYFSRVSLCANAN